MRIYLSLLSSKDWNYLQYIGMCGGGGWKGAIIFLITSTYGIRGGGGYYFLYTCII
jgi:hypothetical protein